MSQAISVGRTKAPVEFVVVSTPDKSLAWTNHVYISPEHASLLPFGPDGNNYVLVKSMFIYVARGHPAIKPGEVALNTIQRETLKLSAGEQVTITSHAASAEQELVTATLELDLRVQRRLEVKESELIEFFRTKFMNQFVGRDQTILADFQGAAVVFSARSLACPAIDQKHGDMTRFVSSGQITKNTQIEVEASKNKLLSIEKSRSAGPNLFKPWDFEKLGIGGLDAEFGNMFRRAFASRMFPPEVISKLGIKHVKGMLLYGPPGTGKTLIARQIGSMLRGREPKIVNGPELFNKFVGETENNIRKLFEDAEKDQEKNADKSDLHVIILDEIDSICKARGSDRSGTGVGDTAVNQFLSKIDGVKSLNNILVIGMTNRKDMIDEAILRPGRLEVHVEIGLPDEKGRVQIFKIHTRKMRENGRLSPDVSLERLAALTKNFSGAEIEGLVKSATSFALYGSVDVTRDKPLARPEDEILVTMEHFYQALEEVKPAFGIDEEDLKSVVRGELIDYGAEYSRLMETCRTLVKQVETSTETPLMSVLLHGADGVGKTAIAAKLGLDSGYPFVKFISPESYIGESEASKAHKLARVFDDAYKSPLSLIIIDNIERLLDYVPIGQRFSNILLQALLVLLKRIPSHEGRKLMIIGTTSNPDILEDMQLKQAFNVHLRVPQLTTPEQITKVFNAMRVDVKESELRIIAQECPRPVPLKQLMMIIEMARQGSGVVTASRFRQCVEDTGLRASTMTIKGRSGRVVATGVPSAAAAAAARPLGSDDEEELTDDDAISVPKL